MRKFINMLTQYSNKCVRSIKAIIDRYITPFIKRCFRFFRKKESVENIFIQEWVAALTENARVFNGLYSGLLRIHEGTAKNPVRILREWCQRTHYKFENQSVDTLCQEYIVPLFEEEQHDTLLKWVNLLLEAAKQAGITREEASALQLTEGHADDYVEWDSDELFPDDEIEIIIPAWYQNGKLLEQGQCRKINEEGA